MDHAKRCRFLAGFVFMNETVDRTQLILHAKWCKTPSTYVKPPHDPLMPRKAILMNSPNCETSLGYILIQRQKIVVTHQAAACEFIHDDPEPLRQFAILRKPPCFLVYYKHDNFWYGCSKHFPTLADAIPYLQSGIRVLIEIK